MKTAVKTSVMAAAIALTATFGAQTAAAAQTSTNWLGTQADIVDGGVVQGWTVSHLQKSNDTIPFPVQGQLWEATASDTSIQGDAVPIIGNFNARAADGTTYRVLWEVATPQGVNPATLTQGATTNGKLYFDVTGSAPDSVVYRGAEGPDVALWLTPPPAAGTSTQGQVASAVPAATTADSPEAAQAAPEAQSLGVPLTEVGPSPAEAPASVGVPATAPSEATPAPLAAPGTPAPAAVPGAPAPAAVPGAPAPAATQGVPAVAPPAAAEVAPPAAPSEEVIVVEAVPVTPPAPATP
ncbi:MAG: MPT63 family protein [Actinomycetia bacterium]|nr:MPT63 family protein [Actinomycetes bacterium]